jgi:hypothetical protein
MEGAGADSIEGGSGARSWRDPAGADAAAGGEALARTGVTTKSRRGGFSTGRMAAATKAASRLER